MAINKIITAKASTHSAMKSCIAYVLRDDKTPDRLIGITGPYNYQDITTQNVYDSFLNEKQAWDKDSGRMYMHSVISFHKDEYITPQEAYDFVLKLVTEEPFYKDYQNLIAIHQEKNHIHSHIVTNTVSYIDGHKEHHSANDVKALMERTNKFCLERGLTVAHKGQHFDGTAIEQPTIAPFHNNEYRLNEQKKESWKREILNTINEVLKTSSSKNEFIESMNNNGITVNWSDDRKHVTFTDMEGHKVRSSTLGRTFDIKYLMTKEALEIKITQKDTVKEKVDVSLPVIEIPSIGNSVNMIADVAVQQIKASKEQENQRAQHI